MTEKYIQGKIAPFQEFKIAKFEKARFHCRTSQITDLKQKITRKDKTGNKGRDGRGRDSKGRNGKAEQDGTVRDETERKKRKKRVSKGREQKRTGWY